MKKPNESHVEPPRSHTSRHGSDPDARQAVGAGWLHVRGARTHNLKNIDVAMPRERCAVTHWPLGSGKSSLAFDTIFAEGQRRYVGKFVCVCATILKSNGEAGRG